MRAMPFEVIFVLGLGEGRFPASAPENPLDLRCARRQPGDVSAAERDRYLFLETLLAARRRLVLSWVARDAKTGDALEPAPVVRELQFILRGHEQPEILAHRTVRHPVVAYDEAYFPTPGAPATALPPVTGPAASAARVRALRRDLERHLGAPVPAEHLVRRHLRREVYEQVRAALRVQPPPTPAPDPEEEPDAPLLLTLGALRRFLESPLQGSARHVLGLREDEDPPPNEGDEPLALDAGTRAALLTEAFFAGAGDADRTDAALARGWERLTLTGAAPVGVFGEHRRARDRETLATWRAHAEAAEVLLVEGWTRPHLGPPTHRDAAAGLTLRPLPILTLTVPVDGRERRVELTGALPALAPDGRAALRCLSRERVEPRDFLPAFLGLAALSALGNPPADGFVAWVLPSAAGAPTATLRRRYRVPPPEIARRWLTELATDLLRGLHPYRMPIEAVLRWRRDLDFRPDAPFTVRPGERTQDDHGPVRDPASFPVPSVDFVRARVDQRLGVWLFAGS